MGMERNNLIRVLLVDDHDMVRMSLMLLLETAEHFIVVGEAVNGEEAVELARRLQPDVILMDLIMPVMNGVQATQEIHDTDPALPVLILTSTVEQHMIQQAYDAGAAGHIAKTGSANQIINAIEALVE